MGFCVCKSEVILTLLCVKTIVSRRDAPRFCFNSLIICLLCYRSLPKLSAQTDEDGTGHSQGPGQTVQLFEPIPHDHSFCERVVINVSISVKDLSGSLLSI